jgi:multidrug efflux pump subunit AcrA (membrane-fusion protein)
MNMITRIDTDGANEVAAPDEARSGTRWRKGAFVAAPLALLLGGLVIANREAPPPPAPPVPTVTVAQPLVRDVNQWDDYVGRFEASRSVEVRPRVSGQITAVHFTDGQTVRKGQILFTIDPRPFAAALAEARAGLASAQSDLALARADLGRAQRLLDDQAVSRSEVDRLQARVRAAEAAVAGAQASSVEIRLQDEADYRWKGRLDFTDNGLDPKSGTIRGRAVLDNPGMFLTPGMFGNMRLANGGTVKALLVPDAAVQTDQARKIVLVVGKDGTVAAKPVAVGALIDGLRVIRSGLTPQDRVVIAGTQIAAPGAKVQVRAGKVTPERIAQAPAIGAPLPNQATFAAR